MTSLDCTTAFLRLVTQGSGLGNHPHWPDTLQEGIQNVTRERDAACNTCILPCPYCVYAVCRVIYQGVARCPCTFGLLISANASDSVTFMCQSRKVTVGLERVTPRLRRAAFVRPKRGQAPYTPPVYILCNGGKESTE